MASVRITARTTGSPPASPSRSSSAGRGSAPCSPATPTTSARSNDSQLGELFKAVEEKQSDTRYEEIGCVVVQPRARPAGGDDRRQAAGRLQRRAVHHRFGRARPVLRRLRIRLGRRRRGRHPGVRRRRRQSRLRRRPRIIPTSTSSGSCSRRCASSARRRCCPASAPSCRGSTSRPPATPATSPSGARSRRITSRSGPAGGSSRSTSST